MSAEPPAFPRALDDDDDDVAWPLQTAAVQWERGGAADAIVWLRRAAEAAAESGKYARSADLQRRANELDRWLKEGPAFSLDNDGDDGVDSLLATEAPEIEAAEAAASPSLVDVLEAEARGEFDTDPLLHRDPEAPVQDLGDLEDVEDIDAVDLDELEARELDDYGDQPLDEITQARSSLSSIPEQPPSAPPSSRAPSSGRASGASRTPGARAPGSSRAPGSRSTGVRSSRVPATATPAPVPLTRKVSSSRAPGTSPPRQALLQPSTRPQPPDYELPPPPAAPGQRLPLPLPQPSTPPPGRTPSRNPFPSEPLTRRRSDPPSRPDLPEGADALEDDPTATPLAIPSRLRAAPVPEVADAELDAPTLGPPPRAPSLAPSRAPSREASVAPPISSAAPAELEAAVQALSETPPPVAVAPALDVALVAACRGLEDLPPETQAELAAKARVEHLAPDQEVSDFGLALVVRGSVLVMPTIAEGACGRAAQGEPVFSRGTLAEGVSLRVVAEAEGAEVAVFRTEDFEHVLETCPWVADELRAVADRYQALAGAAMGPLGDRLDDTMRAMLTDRCTLKVLLAGEVLIEEGKPPSGLYIVGGGHLEVVSGGVVRQELGPGDLPFAGSVLTHEKASGTVRAAASGALVLHADRMTTHELIVSLPPLLELLSMV